MALGTLDKRLAAVRLLALDVDGVFTDGRFLLDEDGREYKTFHTQDGFGIRQLIENGIHVAVITGRRSGAVSSRMRELNVEHVFQGARDKLPVFQNLCRSLSVEPAHSAYVGDDVPDLAVMRAAGVGIAVANAVDEVLSAADWTTRRSGGDGAVREICDRILTLRAAT